MRHAMTTAATLAMLTLGGVGEAAAFFDFQCATVDYYDCANPNFVRPSGCFSSRFRSRCEDIVSGRAQQELQRQADAGELATDEVALERSWSALPGLETMFEHAQGRFTDVYVPPIGDMMTLNERLMALFPVIANCEEYIFQLSHDFALYKIAARYFGDNYAGLYRYAYDWSRLNEGAIGVRAMSSFYASNRSLGGWTFGYMQPRTVDPEFRYRAKNDYFEMSGDALTEFRRRQPALAAVLDQGRSHYYVSNIWSFHRQMGNTLRNESPAKLAFLKARRQDFLRMLDERIQLTRRINDATSSSTRFQLRNQRVALDDGIEHALLEADSAGCLTLTGSTSTSSAHPCDWAHQDFHDEMTSYLQALSDIQYQRCVDITGDDFGDLPPNYRVNNFGPYTVASDPTINEHRFEEFLQGQDEVEAWIGRQLAGSSQAVLPRWGYDTGDTVDKGNDLFGASWSHRAYWHIDNIDRASDDACDVNMRGFARLRADARVFGFERKLFYARAQFNARQRYAEYRFEVRGMQTLSASVRGGSGTQQGYNIVLEPSTPLREEKTLVDYSDTFYLVGFPVTVDAGVTGYIGLDTEVKVPATIRSCSQGIDLRASAEARPYAGLHAFANAGVGITGLRAGAGAEMTVFEAGMPVSLEMRASAPAGREEDLALDIDLNADFDYTALQGSLYAFLEYPTGLDVSWEDGLTVTHRKSKKTLVDFSGYRGVIPVLKSHFDYELPLIRNICARPEHDCGS